MLGSAVFRTGIAPGGALAPGWVKNELWRKARAVPSLDLRFADNKSLVDAVTGAQLVTFTRASSGTFVGSDGLIQTAATNEPRFNHNPITGESLGLLVEEARTNNLLQSEDFSSSWTSSNIAVTTNSVVAPDGTTTADTIAPPADGLTTTRFLRQNPILTTQQAYTLSVFVKVGTATTNGINLYVSDSTATNNFKANFNLFTLTTSPGGAGWAAPTATIVPYPNGWYRCILTGVTSTVHVSLRAQIYLSAFSTVPDTYGSIHVWGAQLEAGAFPTSYIPTTTATVTRAADVASITGSNFSSWYNQTEGTVFFEGINPAVSTTAFAVSDGSTSNCLQMETGTNTRVARVVSGGTTQASNNIAYTYGASQKFAMSYVTNSINFANAGMLGTEDTSATIPTVDQARIGANPTGANPLNNTIKRLTYRPTRFGGSTLQSITQP